MQANTIQELFDGISSRYDKFNYLSSLGRDRAWRLYALKVLKPGMSVLDLGAGTGDLAFAAIPKMQGRGRIVGLDFSSKMLDLARQKAKNIESSDMIEWVCKSAEDIPFEDKLYDVVISGFVLRNLRSSIKSIMKGVFSSLKSGGVISFVDLTDPEQPLLRMMSHFYIKNVVSRIGCTCFRDEEPVQYLQNSIKDFFRASEFKQVLNDIGFKSVNSKSMMFGLVTHYTGVKP